MTIIVAATLPGLLTVLDRTHGSRRSVLTVTDAADVQHRLQDHTRALDAIVLDTTLTPLPDEGVAESLWYLLDAAALREPAARTFLLLPNDLYAPQVRAELITAARRSGGDVLLLPTQCSAADHADAVTWLMGQLHLPTCSTAHWLMPLSAAGGVGKTTQMANLALALHRIWNLHVLMIDADFGNGSLHTFFKIPAGAVEPFMTLRQEVPSTPTMYPLEAVQRRIYQHPCGIDLLLAGRGIVEVADMPLDAIHALFATVRQLPYDVVVLDAGPDIKARPYLVDVLQSGGTGVVLCPPGAKEYAGACAVLELLRHMNAPERTTHLLDHAAVLFLDAERGSVADVHTARANLLAQYPSVRDLGVVPRDPRLVSLVAEQAVFSTVYDGAPRSAYVRALTRISAQLVAHLHLTSATNPAQAAPVRRGRNWRATFGLAQKEGGHATR